MFSSDCHMLATAKTKISSNITSELLHQSSSIDCSDFIETCSNCYQLTTMDNMNEQCMSIGSFEQSKEQRVKNESESGELLDSVLKIQTSTVDEWIDSSLEALYQNEDIQDFNPLVMNANDGSSIEISEDISIPFVSGTVMDDTPAQSGLLEHQALPWLLNLPTQAENIVGTSCLPKVAVCRAARPDTPKQAKKRSAVDGIYIFLCFYLNIV